ncbi:replicative DNA helicase [Cruoricaptor ignavus]|uniref:DNA 5'-3' helicase n=1 Tax=Cruoricaptor ignavus TaxID=1118202 RepID=A0A7M1T4F5_9FLAO|nr:replicative DNA helicase [Cruoricaptor ignavus]QOR74631.1 replicative DNA helicase [Cruoricaptor ignavus]
MKNIDSSVEIEKIVLGTLLIEKNVLENYHMMLSQDLFAVHDHQIIYGVIEKMWNENIAIDMMTVSFELQKKNITHLNAYIIDLSLLVASSANLETHIFYLAELATKRDFISKFSRLLNLAQQTANVDIFEIRDKAFEYFDNLFLDRFVDRNKRTKQFPELIQSVENNFRAILEGKKIGISSSLKLINDVMGGWQNSDLNIVAGRPGMGKTAFMVQQIVDCVEQHIPVGVFSLEMSAEQIAARILTNITNIPNWAVLRKGLNEEELRTYWSLKDKLQSLQIYIDDSAAISIQNLRLKAKIMKLRYNIGILFVDYLQLVTNQESKKNREQEISSISRGLKAIAKELNIPVIALSQLSRNLEQRSDKRPQLSDLRDSGAIEQDADVVMFIFRPEYYGISSWNTDDDGQPAMIDLPSANQAEIIIEKNRHGATHFQRFIINLATSSFQNKSWK